ncbi:ATP-binding SpoIIE family protein phosphatase [Streptomyces sp. 8L]|uniref:ATP-binding SpoIIE family protein phosphatase n=1 Tax=Streptomyces sp. 8L TaxID=2877242 RepID=UPI001CD47AA3|nr:SpoIIE family protein phosphatase [Streptomyces sp. 8L]MCA1220471.1 SpoIIE family protein phosphatase [Streptomyces sp. 8L]
MRTEDVLSANATGLWRWDGASRIVSLDAEAARLLGLPAAPAEIGLPELRARVHPVDWNEVGGVVRLAASEETLAEARLRIVDGDGNVLRTVRSRSRPYVHDGGAHDGGARGSSGAREGRGGGASPDIRGRMFELVGMLQEIAEPEPGATVDGRPVTGDWRRSREAFLLDAGRALAEAHSTEDVLRVAASLSMPGFSPDALAVFGTAGERIKLIGIYGAMQTSEDFDRHLRLDADYAAAEVMRTGRAIYIPSPEEYERRYPLMWEYVRVMHRCSWAYLPLIVGGRTLGAWMAAFKHPVAFSPDERSVLTTVARMLAQALARTEVAETERALSQGLQRAMMPRLAPDLPGMSVAARYVPTGGGLVIGGDWYDMIPLPAGPAGADGRFALVIGDVQGHDVRAASLMGQLRTALRAYASEGHSPDAVLSRASRFFSGLQQHPIVGSDGLPYEEEDEEAGPRFATCLYLEVDPVTGTLDIARAGHPDPVIRMADGTAIIRKTEGGLPLGVETDSDYPTTRLVLGHGEVIMLCTDGLIETGGHDMFTGWDRLRPIIEQHTESALEKESLEKLADALIQSVHGPISHYTTGPLAERREDDIALVLLSRDPARTGGALAAPRRAALTVAQADPERIADARHQLRALLHDWPDEEQIDSAVLMVSEMVTNVLVHTDGDALVSAETAGESGSRTLRVEVADTSDQLPHRRKPGEMASSGRGLVLMEVLADEWGVDPRGDGKMIWFELREHLVAEAGRV